jgi:hypothetical protein
VTAFTDALAALHSDPNLSRTVLYRAGGAGPGVQIQVIWGEQMREVDYGQTGAIAKDIQVSVRLADIANPAIDDTLEPLDAPTQKFKVCAPPQFDVEKVSSNLIRSAAHDHFLPRTDCRRCLMAALQQISGIKTARNRRVALEVADLPMAILFEGDENPNDTFTRAKTPSISNWRSSFPSTSDGADGATLQCLARQDPAAAAVRSHLGRPGRDLQITSPGDFIGVDVNAEEQEGFLLGVLVRYATIEGDPFTFFN